MVLLRWSKFGQDVQFENAVFGGALNLARAQFAGAVSFEGATLHRKPLVDQARASAGPAYTWPPGTKVGRHDDEWLVLTDG
jgi:Pentapeptide repeats (9 copies)